MGGLRLEHHSNDRVESELEFSITEEWEHECNFA